MTTDRTDRQPLCYTKREPPVEMSGRKDPKAPQTTQTVTQVAQENRDRD
jgi:hypothetical protein